MMYIDHKDGCACWHVGQPAPAGVEVEEIISIQADGDELVSVQTNVTGIPMAPRKRVVSWFGDDARFIFENVVNK